MLEALLSFFSDLILFTAGVVVVIIWIVLILIAIDEAIDIFVTSRNKNQEESADVS